MQLKTIFPRNLPLKNQISPAPEQPICRSPSKAATIWTEAARADSTQASHQATQS